MALTASCSRYRPIHTTTLVPLSGWFTGGFDTAADLQEAQALLEGSCVSDDVQTTRIQAVP